MDGPRDEHQGGRLHQPPERLGAATLPELRPLVLELKSQLLMHGLHETRTGGVGGYLLANMVRHMLISHEGDGSPPREGRASDRGGSGVVLVASRVAPWRAHAYAVTGRRSINSP
jgi:hypothetical protein